MRCRIAMTSALLALSMLAAEALAQQTGYQVVEVTDGGTIVGTVTFDGQAPPVPTLETTKNSEVCGESVPDPTAVRVNPNNRGVRWALVYLEGISAGKPPTDRFVLDNEECAFQPHVGGAVQGKTLVIENSDPVLHNTHIYRGRRTAFNGALSFHEGEPQYRPIENDRALRRTGMLDVKCDAHEWMRGYVLVLEHPYFAVTDEGGKFEIGDVPPGTYTLKLWHESLGEQAAQITVAAGSEAAVDFTLRPQG